MDPKPIDMYPDLDKINKGRSGFKAWVMAFNPFPLHCYLAMRFELYQAKVRFLNRNAHKKFKGMTDIKLNIGPGPNAKSDWINLDIAKKPGIDCVYDCRKKLPFEDKSVKLIFMEHVFEHIDYTEEAPYFISECHRILAPGGILRMIVPDIELYMRAYCEDNWESLKRIRPLNDQLEDPFFKCQYRTKMELINVLFRQNFEHKYAYDYETLSFILKRYGFDDVSKQSYMQSHDNELLMDQEQRASESLYVEAVKG